MTTWTHTFGPANLQVDAGPETAKVTGIAESKLYARFPEYVKNKPTGSAGAQPTSVPIPPSAAEAVVEDHTPESAARKPGFLNRFLKA